MTPLIEMVRSLMGEKNANKKRNLTLVAILYVAYELTGIKTRVERIESRLNIAPVAVVTNFQNSHVATADLVKPTL